MGVLETPLETLSLHPHTFLFHYIYLLTSLLLCNMSLLLIKRNKDSYRRSLIRLLVVNLIKYLRHQQL